MAHRAIVVAAVAAVALIAAAIAAVRHEAHHTAEAEALIQVAVHTLVEETHEADSYLTI